MDIRGSGGEPVAIIEAETGRTGSVGIGIPGAISPATGLVMNANSTWNIGRPLQQDLAEALGRRSRPVVRSGGDEPTQVPAAHRTRSRSDRIPAATFDLAASSEVSMIEAISA